MRSGVGREALQRRWRSQARLPLVEVCTALAWLCLAGTWNGAEAGSPALIMAQAAENQSGKAKPLPASPSNTPPSLLADEILILIRTSLLTLNDAMVTGNFTVLRDIIAPSVHEQNTAGNLYQTFSNLIAQRLDLRAAATLTPNLTPPPVIGPDGRLRISGFYPGRSVQTNFELTFEAVNRRWRLYGLSVNIGPPTSATQSESSPGAKSAPAAKNVPGEPKSSGKGKNELPR